MHELGITRNVVAIASEHARGAKVTRVTLEIGKLAAILPDAVRFCFDLCAQGTVVEGATLDIVEIPGRASCRECGKEVVLDRLYGRCACGSADLKLIAGEELKIREMEVDSCA
jgi:hydrogenase nickel incorporation protein HypA/HybF